MIEEVTEVSVSYKECNSCLGRSDLTTIAIAPSDRNRLCLTLCVDCLKEVSDISKRKGV